MIACACQRVVRRRLRRRALNTEPTGNQVGDEADRVAGGLFRLRRGSSPTPALLGRKPCGQEGEAVRGAHRAGILDMKLLAIETETGRAKLHGMVIGSESIPDQTCHSMQASDIL